MTRRVETSSFFNPPLEGGSKFAQRSEANFGEGYVVTYEGAKTAETIF
jgi:hypothetical protein